MTTAKDLNDLSTIYLEAVYGGEKKKEEKKDTQYVVTRADIQGGTRAAKELAKGNPRYKKADHLKNSYEPEGEVIEAFKKLTPNDKDRVRNQAERRSKDANREQSAGNYKASTKKDQEVRNMKKVLNNEVDLDFVNSLIESGKFTEEEIKSIIWDEYYCEGAVGEIAGSVAGGALGSAAGPVGSVVGSVAGGALGGKLLNGGGKVKSSKKPAVKKEEVEQMDEIAGTVGGAIAGGMLGGPLGAVAGGLLGSKLHGGGKVKSSKKPAVKKEEADYFLSDVPVAKELEIKELDQYEKNLGQSRNQTSGAKSAAATADTLGAVAGGLLGSKLHGGGKVKRLKKSNEVKTEEVEQMDEIAGTAGGAIAGGLLGGPLGAVAGGLLGSKLHGGGKVKSPKKPAVKKEEVEQMDEIVGTAGGAIAGGILGGPLGAVAGGLLGSKLDKKKKPEKKEVQEEDYNYVTEYAAALGALAKGVGKTAVRQGIKVGGKAGGRAVQAAGRVAKDAAVEAGTQAATAGVERAGEAAGNAVRNIGRKKPEPETDVEEGYQRNPEKGEKEEKERSKNVRGERTPMPPRGDKRREEFEKWMRTQGM